MGNIEVRLGHSNIADIVLKENQKILRQKNKKHSKRRKTKIQNIF